MQTAAPASTSAASAVLAAPAPTPAPAPISQHQPPRSRLNPSVSSFLAPTLSASLLPTSSVTPVTAPTSSVAAFKDTFKPAKRDKAAGKSVHPFAENFYKVTKGKYDEQINNALMRLCSGDDKLRKFLCAYSASGPTANLNGTAEEWINFPLLCNLRSQFLKPTSHILTVRDALVSEEISADIFRRAPAMWVQAI
jgi:hypothetical protein